MLDFKEACKLIDLDDRHNELCERIESYPPETLLDIAKGINACCGDFEDLADYWEDLEAFCEGMDAYEAAEAVVNGDIQDCQSPIRMDCMGGYETFDPEEEAGYQREEIAAWVAEHDNGIVNGCLPREERDLLEAWEYLDTYGEDLYEDEEDE